MVVTLTDICICGHPVSRHTLVGTEYARCSTHWHCYCEGGVRVAVRVEETVERPSGSQTNARFFRKISSVGGAHPLERGIEKLTAEGYSFQWAVDECDRCGVTVDDIGAEFRGWTVIPQGGAGIVKRSSLVCGFCVEELKWIGEL